MAAASDTPMGRAAGWQPDSYSDSQCAGRTGPRRTQCGIRPDADAPPCRQGSYPRAACHSLRPLEVHLAVLSIAGMTSVR
jgi:hypothetical protein